MVVATGLLAGCARREDRPVRLGDIVRVDSPADLGSMEPNLLVSPGGRVFLSWIQPEKEGRHALRFARRNGASWTEPMTIAQGDDWFINWADFPSLVEFGDGTLAAHWLQKSGVGTYAYGVRVTRSLDGGGTWVDCGWPHPPDTETEHGFVAMVPVPDNRILMAWLDGREFADSTTPNVMTLRAATMDREGRFFDAALLDDRVCDCCQNAAAVTAKGVVVVYRNRSEDEIRDIGIVRFRDGRWTKPRVLYPDGWNIAGCPVNGPSIAARDDRVAVAWFSMANQTPRVKLSFSEDGGDIFDSPLVVDDGDPMGRVDIALFRDGSALVTWMEVVDESAEIRFRRVWPDGRVGESRAITESSPERASGFPVMAATDAEVLFAWTELGDPPSVRTALVRLDG
jgi:hypothetical protein